MKQFAIFEDFDDFIKIKTTYLISCSPFLFSRDAVFQFHFSLTFFFVKYISCVGRNWWQCIEKKAMGSTHETSQSSLALSLLLHNIAASIKRREKSERERRNKSHSTQSAAHISLSFCYVVHKLNRILSRRRGYLCLSVCDMAVAAALLYSHI